MGILKKYDLTEYSTINIIFSMYWKDFRHIKIEFIYIHKSLPLTLFVISEGIFSIDSAVTQQFSTMRKIDTANF